MGGKKDIEYLEEERKKLWNEVVAHKGALAAAQKTIAALQKPRGHV